MTNNYINIFSCLEYRYLVFSVDLMLAVTQRISILCVLSHYIQQDVFAIILHFILLFKLYLTSFLRIISGKEQKLLCDIAMSLFSDPALNTESCHEKTFSSDAVLENALTDGSPKPPVMAPCPLDQPVLCVSGSSSPGDEPLLDSGKNFGDRRHQMSPSVANSQNGSSDLLDVSYSHRIISIRRRSSNLSDVSRRSSVSTKRSSSDLSSDLEEFYESYLKSERMKQHQTIHENGFQPAICNFAMNMVSHLVQEGISTAAQNVPKMLTFDTEPLPDSIVKPYACRPCVQNPMSSPNSYPASAVDPSSVVESYANYLMRSVMTSALTEAALIFKYISTSVDSAISASQISLPEDESYHLFADHIVQDVLFAVSSDYAAGLLGNLSLKCLSYDFGASQTPKEPSVNLSISASSACDTDSQEKKLLDSEIESALSSIAAGETSGFVPVAPSPVNSGQENSICSETPRSIIPKNSEPVVVGGTQNAGIQLSYQEAAAMIVDQVFQSLSHTAEQRNQSKLCGSVKSSNKGISDKDSSVGDAHDCLPSRMECHDHEEVADSNSAILSSFGIPTKYLSRETLTNAFLNVEGRRHIKTYERRSSEPCRISVSLSLKTSGVSKPLSREDKKCRPLRTEEDFLQVLNKDSMRRGSWSSFPTNRRRSSCGFRDPVLSKFAEELLKADTSIPPLLIMSAHTGTSTTGSRRSSGFRDLTLANLEGELLNSSFRLTSSPHQSVRSRSNCGANHYDRFLRSESTCSEAEYWFPLPKKVGHEFQEEFDRLGRYHSVDEIEDLADTFANNIIQQAISIIYSDACLDVSTCCLNHPNLLSYATSLAHDITQSAILTVQGMTKKEKEKMRRSSWQQGGKRSLAVDSDNEFVDTLDVPLPKVQLLAENMAEEILNSVLGICDKPSAPMVSNLILTV